MMSDFLRVVIVSALLLAWLMSAVLVVAQSEDGNAVPPPDISPVREVGLVSQDNDIGQPNTGNTASVVVRCLPVGGEAGP